MANRIFPIRISLGSKRNQNLKRNIQILFGVVLLGGDDVRKIFIVVVKIEIDVVVPEPCSFDVD